MRLSVGWLAVATWFLSAGVGIGQLRTEAFRSIRETFLGPKKQK